jgi:hypothetical protein
MTLKKISIHVLISALLAIVASLIYNTIYSSAFELNFSSVLNIGGIIGSTLIGCTLMGLGYYVGYKWKGEKSIPWINILISVLSFASIVGVLGIQLPLTIESPEMFPGLAIPMHFFPALAFFTISPFFKIK